MKHKKKCTKCKKNLPLSSFHRSGYNYNSKGRWKKYKSKCADCLNKEKRDKRALQKQIIKQEAKPNPTELMVSALIALSRYDLERLENITKEEFASKTNSETIISQVEFDAIVDLAKQQLHENGLYHPEKMFLTEGVYLIVGDSHGKHTKTKMFNLLKNLNKNLDINNIIHVGHILDDDNIISHCWKDFENLIVLSKDEELHTVEQNLQRGYKFQIVRDEITIGNNLRIMNQNMITDYVKTALDTFSAQYCDFMSVVTNLHRHEMDTRCTYDNFLFVASPGCLCEKHIVKTIKQIDFISGYQVKEAKPESFHKYRRMKHLYEHWEQGIMLIEVDSQGNAHIIPLRIHLVDNEYTTVYFDKVYAGSEIIKPDKKIFVNTDLHCPRHDPDVLSIQEQVVEELQPDVFVNLGDIQSNDAFNHHEMKKSEVIQDCLYNESKELIYVLEKMSTWADEKYFLMGNHERFVEDFYKRYPQFKQFFIALLNSPLQKNNYNVVDNQDVLESNNICFIHGDLKMYGQKGGNLLNKLKNTFFRTMVVGHLHHTAIRNGIYIIGMSGQYEQLYNEVNASKWVQGFGIVVQYQDKSWVTPYNICFNNTMVNGIEITSSDNNDWVVPHNYEISFDLQEKNYNTV